MIWKQKGAFQIQLYLSLKYLNVEVFFYLIVHKDSESNDGIA